MRIKSLILLGLVGVLLSTGCSTQGAVNAGPTTYPPGDTHYSFVELVDTISALTERATIVVVGRVTSFEDFDFHGVPHRESRLIVDEVLFGDTKVQEVTVRQTGKSGEVPDLGTPVLQEGKTYLIFLQPFEFERGKPLEQYVIIDPGVWVETGSGTFEILFAGAKEIGLKDIPVKTDVAFLKALLIDSTNG